VVVAVTDTFNHNHAVHTKHPPIIRRPTADAANIIMRPQEATVIHDIIYLEPLAGAAEQPPAGNRHCKRHSITAVATASKLGCITMGTNTMTRAITTAINRRKEEVMAKCQPTTDNHHHQTAYHQAFALDSKRH
jgi:hypothetical protein